MYIEKMKCPTCEEHPGRFPGAYDKCTVCEGTGTLPDSRISNPDCPVCKNHPGRFPGRYDICSQCDGWGKLRDEDVVAKKNLTIMVLKEGKPHTAHSEIADIFKDLSGVIRVCDPYYGTGSLSRLELLQECQSIMFLTKKPDSSEKTYINKRIEEFNEEYPQFKFRKFKGKGLHDRYILSKEKLIILGQGIKDVGKKESFALVVDRSILGHIIDDLIQSFDNKWANSESILL